MNITTSVPPAIDRSHAILLTITEPIERDLNPHVRQRITADIRLIKEALEMHGYPCSKLENRQVWRIGTARNCWLLSYKFSPFNWVVFPHHDNLFNIINQARGPESVQIIMVTPTT